MKLVQGVALAATMLVAAACGGGVGSGAGAGTPSAAGAPPSSTGRAPAAKPSSVSLALQVGSQTELVLPTGRHVFINVAQPDLLSAKPTSNDVLLVSGGVYAVDFAQSFPGRKLIGEAGRIALADVSVTGVAATRQLDTEIDETNPTDVIFVIETAGLRIVHFGEIGEAGLTPAQAAAVGPVDVALSGIFDHHTGVDATSQAGLKLMKQVGPRLFIPTFANLETLKQFTAEWTAQYSTKPSIALAPDALPKDRTMLILGSQAELYGSALGLQQGTW